MQQLKAVQQALKESKESLADIVPENDGTFSLSKQFSMLALKVT